MILESEKQYRLRTLVTVQKKTTFSFDLPFAQRVWLGFPIAVVAVSMSSFVSSQAQNQPLETRIFLCDYGNMNDYYGGSSA